MFGGLWEFLNIKEMVLPKIIRIFYWIGIATIIIGGALGCLLGIIGFLGGLLKGEVMNAIGSLFSIFGVIILMILGVLVVRIYAELFLVIFNIHDALNRIEKKLK